MSLSTIRQMILDLVQHGGTLDEYARLKLAELDAREAEKKVIRGGGVQLL